MYSKMCISVFTVIAVLTAICAIHVRPCPADTVPLKPWLGEQTDDPVNVNIVDFEITFWPVITLYVQVTDDAGDPILGLTEENFEVTENNTLVLDDVLFYELDGTAYGMALDCSGSMSGYESDVIYACTTFVAQMHPLEQAAIVFFGYYSSTSVVQLMTNNHNWLMNTVLTYYAYGATALWYGYTLALEQCKFELPPRIVIGFTDGQDNQSGSYTQQTVTMMAQGIGAPVYSIGLGGVVPGPLIEVANATGGSYIQTVPDSLWFYYQQIQHAYQNQYKVAYITPSPIPDGTPRDVLLQVDYMGNTGGDSTRFTAPWVYDFAPIITLTPATIDPIMLYPQPQGNPVTVEAHVTDNDVLTNVMIRFRQIGDTYYNHAIMVRVADSLYQHVFGGDFMQPPGVEFYILASDSYNHTTSNPQYDPAAYPNQVVVEPNARPEIDHTPITSWPELTPMPVIATVVDVTANVASVELAYRNESEIYWTETAMQNTGGDTWEGTVPGDDLLESLNLEYFIRAFDDAGTRATDGPHLLDVEGIALDVILTPVNPPVQIPATGGSFDFNIQLINLDSDPLVFDAWIMVTLPNGAPYGPVLGPVNLTLPGSTTLERDRTQTVPAVAPPGEYVYEAFGGNYPSVIWASDSFTFEKLASGDGQAMSAWSNSGEAFNPWLTSHDGVTYPSELELGSAYPNPFNAAATIGFSLPEGSYVTLTVYDISGRELTVLLSGWREAGIHEVTFKAAELTSGVYICRLEAGGDIMTQKMILLK